MRSRDASLLLAVLALLGLAGRAAAQDARPLCTTADRTCLKLTATAYFDAVLKADGAALPFASDVRVTEQGHVVATSRAAFLKEFKTTGATKGLRNMRMVVDETAGEVAVLVLGDVRMEGQAPFTVRRIQRMKIDRGLIREIELVIYIDKNPAPLWPDA
jgi:hypothetical protein